MANQYSWPPMDNRRVMGTRVSRLDGPPKASGQAKYSSDVNPAGLLHAVVLSAPYAHARVVSIDTSEAEALKGVTAVRKIIKAGQEVQWQGQEIASIAAETEEIARDAAGRIKVQYEVLPHLVQEQDLAKTEGYAKPSGEQVTGDPEQAFKDAEVTIDGRYGMPVVTHCCLEPHGQTIQWKGDRIEYWPSTQNVSGIGTDLAKALEIPATGISVHMDYMGGGFGSKFSAEVWGIEAAQLSKASGGRPVKLFLDREQELLIAGNRPSAFAKVKLACTKDGKLTAWNSETWGSGGINGAGMPPLPYVYRKIPNFRLNHTAVSTNTGAQRAWRAPNNQHSSYITCGAMEDLAAKLKMDPLEFFSLNADLTNRPEVYRTQLAKAAEMMEWKKNWHQRGSETGHLRRGLGIGVAMWGGAGHASTSKASIHPDGSVEIELGSQDVGSGTRTILAMVAAETFGLPVKAIKAKIGQSDYPNSDASGGSTTVGGVSSSTRKATVNALNALFAVVAPVMNVTSDQLEAVDGRIQVKGNAAKSLTWVSACNKLGTRTISETGKNDPRNPGDLNTGGASGVQMADVTVDIETGIVKMNRMVAVQDCGLIINPKTAESQVYGACIMSICSALMEERVADQQTGTILNADMEFYKLAGIKDIGEIIVHMDVRPEHDRRGVVGLGEPPAIPGIAAIANAAANAVGMRIPMIPLTPYRVLAALEGSNA